LGSGHAGWCGDPSPQCSRSEGGQAGACRPQVLPSSLPSGAPRGAVGAAAPRCVHPSGPGLWRPWVGVWGSRPCPPPSAAGWLCELLPALGSPPPRGRGCGVLGSPALPQRRRSRAFHPVVTGLRAPAMSRALGVPLRPQQTLPADLQGGVRAPCWGQRPVHLETWLPGPRVLWRQHCRRAVVGGLVSSTLSRRLGRGSLTSHGLWRRPGPDFTDGSSSVSLNLGGWRGWRFIRQCEGWSHTARGTQALPPRPRPRPAPWTRASSRSSPRPHAGSPLPRQRLPAPSLLVLSVCLPVTDPCGPLPVTALSPWGGSSCLACFQRLESALQEQGCTRPPRPPLNPRHLTRLVLRVIEAGAADPSSGVQEVAGQGFEPGFDLGLLFFRMPPHRVDF